MPYGMDNINKTIPAGIPFSKIKRSNETGSLFTGAFWGVLTKDAMMNQFVHEPSEDKKMVSKEIPALCINKPTIGPVDMAKLFINP